MKQKGLGRRLLVDVGVGLGIITAAALLLVFSIVTGKGVPSRWGAFAVFTPFVFWFVVRQSRRHWHQPSFWLATTVLLVAHIGLFVFVLTRYPDWPPIWFAPVSIVEVGLFSLTLDKLVARGWRRHRPF